MPWHPAVLPAFPGMVWAGWGFVCVSKELRRNGISRGKGFWEPQVCPHTAQLCSSSGGNGWKAHEQLKGTGWAPEISPVKYPGSGSAQTHPVGSLWPQSTESGEGTMQDSLPRTKVQHIWSQGKQKRVHWPKYNPLKLMLELQVDNCDNIYFINLPFALPVSNLLFHYSKSTNPVIPLLKKMWWGPRVCCEENPSPVGHGIIQTTHSRLHFRV